MTNIIVMVHAELSMLTFKGILSRLQGVKLIWAPLDWSYLDLATQIDCLHILLQKEGVLSAEIDFFIVESNYANRAGLSANIKLLRYIKSQFMNANLIAYGNTTESLGEALCVDNTIKVMNCDINLENDLSKFSNLGMISSRVLSASKLRQAILNYGKEEKTHERSSAQLSLTYESESSLPRRNISPILPLYSTIEKRPSSEEINELPRLAEGLDFPCGPS